MTKATLRISSALTLETRAGTLAGKRWMELLESIHSTHSITAAAQAIGLSYKAAWDAVEAMNNLSVQPLVERTKGGKGGGGTRLTARGEQLLTTFKAIEIENNRFVDALNSRIGGNPTTLQQDLKIIGRLSMVTSARNHFSGKVVRIRKGVVNDEVELAISGGERIVAVITHESLENLRLKRGSEVVALIKASWIIVAIDDGAGLRLSARNQLAGTVRRLTPGAVNTEVVIDIKGGNSVAAVITNESAQALKLVKGKPAVAIFKASSVILGVSG